MNELRVAAHMKPSALEHAAPPTEERVSDIAVGDIADDQRARVRSRKSDTMQLAVVGAQETASQGTGRPFVLRTLLAPLADGMRVPPPEIDLLAVSKLESRSRRRPRFGRERQPVDFACRVQRGDLSRDFDEELFRLDIAVQ
jgi:hypothetical protein